MTVTQSAQQTLGRGVAAGLVGVSVMTAFQRFVEMPLTGRQESDAPAELVMKLSPLRPKRRRDRRRLNYVAHFAVGLSWGAGHALIATRAGLHGQQAIAAVFSAIYTGDVVANTALGLTKPWKWSRQDWVVDVLDKYVLAEATGLVYDRLAAAD